jgi:hypothetical protein
MSAAFDPRNARRDVDADDHHLQQAAPHVTDQRCDEFDDARADFGAIHDEPGQNEERKREKDEAAGAPLRVHHNAHQVTRPDGLDAHDADGGEHEADRHAHCDKRKEDHRENQVKRLRMRGQERRGCHEQQHRYRYRGAGRGDRAPRSLKERITRAHHEQGTADGDRQRHPDVVDAEEDGRFLDVGGHERDRIAADEQRHDDHHPFGASLEEFVPGARGAVGKQGDRDELPAAVGNRAAHECERDEEQRRGLVDAHERRGVEERAHHRVDEHEDHFRHERDVEQDDDGAIEHVDPRRHRLRVLSGVALGNRSRNGCGIGLHQAPPRP